MALLDDFPNLIFEVGKSGIGGKFRCAKPVGSELGIPPQLPPHWGVVGGGYPGCLQTTVFPDFQVFGKSREKCVFGVSRSYRKQKKSVRG